MKFIICSLFSSFFLGHFFLLLLLFCWEFKTIFSCGLCFRQITLNLNAVHPQCFGAKRLYSICAFNQCNLFSIQNCLHRSAHGIFFVFFFWLMDDKKRCQRYNIKKMAAAVDSGSSEAGTKNSSHYEENHEID